MSRNRANLLLLLAGAIWGMGFVAQSTAMASIGPWTYTAAKFFLAALALLPFALRETRRAAVPAFKGVGGFAVIGLFLFFAALLQQLGMTTTSVTNAGFLTGLYVVLTPILSLLLFGARPHAVVWPAAILAFAGIVLVGGGEIARLTPGDGLVIASAVFWAMQILLIGRLGTASAHPFVLAFVQFAVAAALATIGALILEAPGAASLLAAAPEILYGGLLSTGLAFTLQVLAQRHTSAPQAAIFLSSEALFAALFGAIFLAERIPPIGFLGCAMIFAAMLAVELVPAQRLAARSRAAASE